MSGAETGSAEPARIADGGSWEEVWRIFEDAVDLPEDEVAELLDRECGDRAALRHAVLDLLAADRTTEGAFFDRPVLERPGTDSGTSPRPTSRSLPAGVPAIIGH